MAAKKKDVPGGEPETEQEERTDASPEEQTGEAETAESPESTEKAAESGPANDKYLRLLAEFENYKKRSARERENIYTDLRADTVQKFLPVYDNLERAMNAETADEAYKKGVELTFQQLLDIFKKLGVEAIPAEGEHFDPTVHNAVMHVEDESLGENLVVQELQKGFRIGDKVIRFSMVKVAN